MSLERIIEALLESEQERDGYFEEQSSSRIFSVASRPNWHIKSGIRRAR
jgi:hypothetical protein